MIKWITVILVKIVLKYGLVFFFSLFHCSKLFYVPYFKENLGRSYSFPSSQGNYNIVSRHLKTQLPFKWKLLLAIPVFSNMRRNNDNTISAQERTFLPKVVLWITLSWDIVSFYYVVRRARKLSISWTMRHWEILQFSLIGLS